jgi:hypothetical protein
MNINKNLLIIVAACAVGYYIWRKNDPTSILNDRYPMAYR